MSKRRGRKKGRLYPQLRTKVEGVVKKYPGASTHEVASRANVSWVTADKYLGSLYRDKKIKRRKRGNKTIWVKR